MKWWQKLWEREHKAESQPVTPAAQEEVPPQSEPLPLWIQPLEERITVAMIWGG